MWEKAKAPDENPCKWIPSRENMQSLHRTAVGPLGFELRAFPENCICLNSLVFMKIAQNSYYPQMTCLLETFVIAYVRKY